MRDQVAGLDDSLKLPRIWPCPRPAHFSILVAYARGYLILQLSGTLDGESADAFCECADMAITRRPQRLVLEMSGLAPLGPVGAACFRRVARRVEQEGVQVALESPDDETLRALFEVGLLDAFPVQ
jgi:anti-anti-sigma factor